MRGEADRLHEAIVCIPYLALGKGFGGLLSQLFLLLKVDI